MKLTKIFLAVAMVTTSMATAIHIARDESICHQTANAASVSTSREATNQCATRSAVCAIFGFSDYARSISLTMPDSTVS